MSCTVTVYLDHLVNPPNITRWICLLSSSSKLFCYLLSEHRWFLRICLSAQLDIENKYTDTLLTGYPAVFYHSSCCSMQTHPDLSLYLTHTHSVCCNTAKVSWCEVLSYPLWRIQCFSILIKSLGYLVCLLKRKSVCLLVCVRSKHTSINKGTRGTPEGCTYTQESTNGNFLRIILLFYNLSCILCSFVHQL